jgi:hypothetical protein
MGFTRTALVHQDDIAALVDALESGSDGGVAGGGCFTGAAYQI